MFKIRLANTIQVLASKYQGYRGMKTLQGREELLRGKPEEPVEEERDRSTAFLIIKRAYHPMRKKII